MPIENPPKTTGTKRPWSNTHDEEEEYIGLSFLANDFNKASRKNKQDKGKFFQILNEMLDDPRYKVPGKTTFPSRFAVYCVLVRRMDAKTRQCYPSRRNIAKLSGLSIRTVDAALEDLEELGLITIQRRNYGDTDASTSHLFTVSKI